MVYATLLCVDRKGAIYDGRPTGMNPVKDEVAKYTNKNRIEGSLADVVQRCGRIHWCICRRCINRRDGSYNE